MFTAGLPKSLLGRQHHPGSASIAGILTVPYANFIENVIVSFNWSKEEETLFHSFSSGREQILLQILRHQVVPRIGKHTLSV